ncbi:MAG TPA: protein kinase, partial [archaeon]|nr:protein kinase [archaeon]
GNEICQGLEKAHKTGVIHRDLKPGNIMLTKTGAKLMDFGLAKAVATATPPPASSLTATLNRPEGSHPLTAQGTVVGTFQYMSPEQVEGKEADARSDIFALGAVLYEMATGKRAFEGKTTASVIAAVLAAEPQPISVVQPMSPPALDRVVKTCLKKDPDERFQSVHDVKLQLKWVAEGGSQAGVPARVAVQRKNRERVAWSVAAVALLAALALAVVHFRAAAETRVVRSTILPPDGGTFVFLGPTGAPMVSPDGGSIVYLARVGAVTQLWVRPLDSFKPRALPGTEDAYAAFWSPDSRNIGFFAQGKLKRIAAAAGPALTLCDIDQARGGSWSRQDVIIFGKYPGEIYRVSASGGTPQPVTQLDSTRHDTTQRWPYFLPDGNHFLYMASALGSASDDNVFAVGSLDGKSNRILFHATSPMAYDSGYLLYVVDRTLMARPFDAARLEFSGDAVPVAEGVQFDSIFSNGVFSTSGSGVLLYQTGNSASERKLDVLDTTGKTLTHLGETVPSFAARVSPDGKRVAFSLIDVRTGRADIWVHDIASGNRTRITTDPVRSQFPVWSRDGSRIAYQSTRTGKMVIYAKPSNGMGVEEKLWEPAVAGFPQDWTPDSKNVIVRDRNPATGKDRLVLVPADGKGEPSTLLEVPGATVHGARLSTDGRWMAYQCDESGKYEVYVSPFPKPVERLQISLAGGRMPAWRSDGKELYYLDPNGNVTAAELKESNGILQVTARRGLFAIQATNANDSYDAFPDGKKFLENTIITAETPAPLSLVQNWAAELKK